MADENPIEKMTPGQILADASVAEFIKAMGLSIADAQKALDLNSLAQVGEYVEPRPGLGGKSLLQLGLSPPFYHYQHADLSVSMQLTMKVGEASAFGIGGKLDFGFGQGGPQAPASAREAQITLKSLPASVTVDGTKTDAAGADVEAAAEDLAKKLGTPSGKFERAYVSAKRTKVPFKLLPDNAKNPIKTDTSVAFYAATESSLGVIRIIETPPDKTSEEFVLASGKSTKVEAKANSLLYARAVASQINALGGFKAKLLRDPVGSDLPVGGGTLGLALFDTDKSDLKKEAIDELTPVARALKANGATVDVIGFTDRQGGDAYNLKLGQDRANKVAAFLIDNGVKSSQIRKTESRGESRWLGTDDKVANQQFRRAEVMLADSNDLLVVVESAGTQLQATPTPDKTSSGGGNGFIIVRHFEAVPVDGTAVKVGASDTEVAISGAAASDGGATLEANSPQAYAFNLARDVNAGSATHGVRAVRKGGVVSFSDAKDAVIINLVTLSANDIALSAAEGASVTKALDKIAAAPTASADKPKVSVAVGLSVDYRTSRQFEQSINGNSSISARIVAVPAPVEFLEEIKTFLTPAKDSTPTPTPTPTP
ncbi:hypothetical protein AS593_01390 [Caulobacter vibrioides]|nr:hypothetical protein AS593_01390 [Caulobacter vibrioides]